MNRFYDWKKLPTETVWTRLTWSDDDRKVGNELPGYEYVDGGTRAIDILGQEVFVGDTIAVSLTAGRSAEMAVGKITAFKPRKDTYNYPPREDYIWVDIEWEARSYTREVKKSHIDPSLPKYLKLG